MFDLDSVKELFKTEPNTAFFWSGLGENGAEIAKETAKANGGVTLEMLMEQNKQQLIEAGFPYDEDFDRFIWNGTDPENVKAWQDLSEAYANQASGNVRAVLGDNIRSEDELRAVFPEYDSLENLEKFKVRQLELEYNKFIKNLDSIPVEQISDVRANYLKAVGKTEDTLGFFDKRILKLLEGKLSVLKDRFI